MTSTVGVEGKLWNGLGKVVGTDCAILLLVVSVLSSVSESK